MAKGRNTVATGAKGLSKSPKSGSAGKGIKQKLNTSNLGGATGMDLKSKLEGAASVPYKGISMPGVKHGGHHLAGKGGRSGGGKLGA